MQVRTLEAAIDLDARHELQSGLQSPVAGFVQPPHGVMVRQGEEVNAPGGAFADDVGGTELSVAAVLRMNM